VVLPEAEWQSSATRLGLQLMSAGARAVYQAQLPLQLVASLDLGCVASVAPSARQRTLGEGFALKELQVGDGVIADACGALCILLPAHRCMCLSPHHPASPNFCCRITTVMNGLNEEG
jgi:hypothetical protein